MADPVNLAHLTQEWVHSREEDTVTSTVYRPASYPFPPSRGRQGFELRPDGTLIEAGPGPTDRPEQTEGTWRLTDDCLELFRTAAESPPRVLAIESVDKDKLVIRKDPSACPAPRQG